MVVHAGIAEVEPLQVGHRRRLDHLAELEGAAEKRDLSEVVGDKRQFVLDCEVLNLGGRGRSSRLRWRLRAAGAGRRSRGNGR